MDEMQLAKYEIKDTQQNVQECIVFNISSKISHNFQSIYHNIVNLWKNVCIQ